MLNFYQAAQLLTTLSKLPLIERTQKNSTQVFNVINYIYAEEIFAVLATLFTVCIIFAILNLRSLTV